MLDQGWLHGCEICAEQGPILRRFLCSVSSSAGAVSKFILILSLLVCFKSVQCVKDMCTKEWMRRGDILDNSTYMHTVVVQQQCPCTPLAWPLEVPVYTMGWSKQQQPRLQERGEILHGGTTPEHLVGGRLAYSSLQLILKTAQISMFQPERQDINCWCSDSRLHWQIITK